MGHDSVITIGTINGMIKDYDMKTKCFIRGSNLHNSKKVIKIVSQASYLMSLSVDGLLIVYDYAKH